VNGTVEVHPAAEAAAAAERAIANVATAAISLCKSKLLL
jgi:hypothetical protein